MCYDVCRGSHPHFGGIRRKMGGKFRTIKTTFLLKLLTRKKRVLRKNLHLKPIAFSQVTEAYLGPCQTCMIVQLLKLVSAIFYQIFIFSPNDSPSKTMKSVFYFILKALFVLEIFKFLSFFHFLSTLSRYKRTNGSGIIYDVLNWLA